MNKNELFIVLLIVLLLIGIIIKIIFESIILRKYFIRQARKIHPIQNVAVTASENNNNSPVPSP